MDNIINELKKLDKQAWADYGTVSDILEHNGTNWSDINDKLGDLPDWLLSVDDIVLYLNERIEQTEGEIESEELYNDDMLQEDIYYDKKDIEYYLSFDGALYQYCEGGDFEFYRLTNEDVMMMLSSLV